MQEYCKCDKVVGTHTGQDDWGYWDICNKCNKPIEASYIEFNHYDGEDHCYDEVDLIR